MSTVRKRKNMLRKLNTYFLAKGKILTEREYKEAADGPFRLSLILKFIGPWPRMVSFLKYYYPHWEDNDVPLPIMPPEPPPKIVPPPIRIDPPIEDKPTSRARAKK